MKRIHWLCAAALLVTAPFAGCKDAAPEKAETPKNIAQPQSPEDKFTANLAKLDVADRKLAEAQRFCAVENENRLGSMGAPVKIIVKDQSVFLCCKSCQKSALADPDKTVAAVAQLIRNSAESPAR